MHQVREGGMDGKVHEVREGQVHEVREGGMDRCIR